MGRQAYITRLALGRSPFEDLTVSPTAEEIRSADLEAKAATETGTYVPSSEGYVQRYDRRGHPQNLASEILREQSRRAQNSVSSTLNGYRDNKGQLPENSDDKSPIDPATIEAVRSENTFGMLVRMTDHCLFFSTNICLGGVRQRLQTFHLYTGASLWEVLKFEWIHFDLKKMLFAGFLATSVFRLLRLRKHRSRMHTLQRHGEHGAGLSATLNQIRQGTIFILTTPLKIHAIRQTLDLIAMRPFLPAPTAFIPFTYQSFLQRLRLLSPLTFASYAQDIKSLLLCPLVLWCIIFYCKRHAYLTTEYYLQFIFPRPDNPDIYSLKGAKKDGFAPGHIPGTGRTHSGQLSLISEVKKDFMASIQKFQTHLERLRKIWQRKEVKVRSTCRTALVDEPARFVDTEHVNTVTESARARRPHSGFEELIRSIPKKKKTSRRPHHHVTFLSGAPASLLGRHLACNITDLLFIPLESYFLRSVAHSYLSSPQAPSSASGINSSHQILPVGSWFGVGLRAGGWRGVVSYAGKIGLWWGIEVAVGYLVWQLHAGIVWWYAPWARSRSRDKIGHDRDRGGKSEDA